jgi:hypothetical protein
MKLNRTSCFIILYSITSFIGCEHKLQDDFHPEDYHPDGEVQTIFKHDSAAVNIVFIGDGYILPDLKKGGKYESDILALSDYLFRKQPYKAYQNNFNAFIVYAQSKASGADLDPGSDLIDSKFNSSYNIGGIDRLLGPQNTGLCYTYSAKAIQFPDIVILVVNDTKYGGSGGAITTVSTNTNSKLILLHELGHSFGGLADEYNDDYVSQFYPISQIGLYPNVDTTDNLNSIKWSYFIETGIYSQVGAFEGGYYRANNVWRPEESSIMLSLAYEYYNAPSREAIVKKILNIAGKTYSFQDFVQNDVIEGLRIQINPSDDYMMLPPPAYYERTLYKQ